MSSDKKQTILHEATFRNTLVSAAAGSQAAWREIVSDLDPQLQRYVASQGVTDPQAVVGEVWLSVARRLHGFEGEYGQFRSWIFTIAHSRIIDARRSATRRPTAELTEQVIARAPVDASAEDVAMLSFSAEYLDQVLSQLPAAQRDVVTLRFVGGFSHPEIAEILSKRVTAVHALQRRAFKNLRKILEPQHPTS